VRYFYLCLLLAAPASAEIFAAAELHGSLLSDVPDAAVLQSTFGGGVRGGYRWESGAGAYLQFEQNLWLAAESSGEFVDGAYNIGLGGEYVYAGGFVRTALAMGPSILAFDTVLDQAGSTGIFIDARPVGLRWQLHERVLLGVDPIHWALVAPVIDGIPLIQIEYRTAIYVESSF
jgi:hypothetical protein